MVRFSVIVAAFCVLLGSPQAHAQGRRAATRSHAARARPAMRRVRAAMRALGPDVQRCADRSPPLPGEGTHRRLRLRVWLLPSGRWTLEVPELEWRDSHGTPYRERRAMIRLFDCLNVAVGRRVGPFVRAYRDPRRQKVERAFNVTVRISSPPDQPEDP